MRRASNGAEADGEPQHPNAQAARGDEVTYLVADDQEVAHGQHGGGGTES
jgi:hypothetical protein